MAEKLKTTYSFGPFVLNPSEWTLKRGEVNIDLPPKAFSVLALLVERAGTLVLKDEILNAIWKDTFVEEGNVAFYVAAIRRVLDDPPGTTYIETVKTRGYRFVAPVAASGEPKVPVEAPRPDLAVGRQKFWVGAAALVLSLGLFVAWPVLFGGYKPIKSVVVMPFHAIAPADDQAYLESGIAESIAVRLGSIQTLRVPPFAAVRHGEGPFEAGKRLGTDAVVTGTIQKTRDRLHVSVELSRVDESAQFWSWTFDALPGEILKVEHEIAERVAARLGAKLMDDGGRLVRRETVSGEAYDLFLQAREQWKLRNPASVRTAIGLYEKAIQIDPDFARAYAGLADCYNITMSGIPAKVRYTLAKANAEKAIALDPESAEGHTSLAFMRYKLEWRWRDADAEFKRAIALDPRYQLAHHWYGEFLRLMGKTEEGITELKIALDLAPESLAARTDLIAAVVQGKHLAEARALLDAGLKIDPNWGAFNVWMSEILAREGREKESVENLWRWMSLRGVPMSEVDELRAGYAKGRMQGMLRAQVQQYLRQEVKPTSSASFEIATFLSFTYARLGDREEAFHWLDIAIDRHQDAAIHLLTNPSYDSIRSSPRFDQLLTRLDLKGY